METEIQKLNEATRAFFSALREFQDNTDFEVESIIESVDRQVEDLVAGIDQ
jgi:hypothetical protein